MQTGDVWPGRKECSGCPVLIIFTGHLIGTVVVTRLHGLTLLSASGFRKQWTSSRGFRCKVQYCEGLHVGQSRSRKTVLTLLLHMQLPAGFGVQNETSVAVTGKLWEARYAAFDRGILTLIGRISPEWRGAWNVRLECCTTIYLLRARSHGLGRWGACNLLVEYRAYLTDWHIKAA